MNKIQERREWHRNNYRRKNNKKTTRERIIWAEIEDKALKYIPGAKKIAKLCDYEWYDKFVDLKVARFEKAFTCRNKLGEKKYSWRWRFATSRQRRIADYFLCIGYDEKGEKVKFVMLIPDKDIKSKNISISLKSFNKYKRYLLKK